jgi:hypothetical protein
VIGLVTTPSSEQRLAGWLAGCAGGGVVEGRWMVDGEEVDGWMDGGGLDGGWMIEWPERLFHFLSFSSNMFSLWLLLLLLLLQDRRVAKQELGELELYQLAITFLHW